MVLLKVLYQREYVVPGSCMVTDGMSKEIVYRYQKELSCGEYVPWHFGGASRLYVWNCSGYPETCGFTR